METVGIVLITLAVIAGLIAGLGALAALVTSAWSH